LIPIDESLPRNLDGRVIFVNDVQSLKQSLLIQPIKNVVTELGITTDSSEEHPSKQRWPIVVTESGIMIDFSAEHPLKQ